MRLLVIKRSWLAWSAFGVAIFGAHIAGGLGRLRDPFGARPLTEADAERTLVFPGYGLAAVDDVDGDGRMDLVVATGHEWLQDIERFELVSAASGEILRTLWTAPRPIDYQTLAWDVRGSVLLIGLPADSSAGEAFVIDASSGVIRARIQGAAAEDRFGAAVAIVGDADGDGAPDLAIGAPQCDVPRACSAAPGYVSLRSSADGRELWRADGPRAGGAFGFHVDAVGDLDGDGVGDVLAQGSPVLDVPVALLSGASGARLGEIEHRGSHCGSAGDVDGDGVADVYAHSASGTDLRTHELEVIFVSGRTRTPLWTLPYPDMWSNYSMVRALGDLDGDGCGEIAIGDANFGLYGVRVFPGFHTVRSASWIESDPHYSAVETGCAIIYSGRTQEPIWGIWGWGGTGLDVALLPSNDDTPPTVAVGTAGRVFFLRGPSRH